MRLSIAVVKYESGEGYIPFPSPLGEMGLSIGMADASPRRDAVVVSVPSRGNGVIDYFSQSDGIARCAKFPSPLGEMGLSIGVRHRRQHRGIRLQPVSVPCRGKGVIDYTTTSGRPRRPWFPSPLGEMGLSIYYQTQGRALERPSEFPSPLGEMGLSIVSDCMMLLGLSLEFPSPLGEMGLSIALEAAIAALDGVFPSPLGEMGLSIWLLNG